MGHRIAIVGSRNYQYLDNVARFIQILPYDDIIISGGARGVDTAAVDACKFLSRTYKVFLPDWDKHGKAAGFIRNGEIVDNCDRLVAFWDHRSNGTRDSIEKATKQNKPVLVFRDHPGLDDWYILTGADQWANIS